MTFDEIFNNMDFCTMYILPKTDRTNTFHQVQYLFGYEPRFFDNTLYMCKASELEALDEIPEIYAIVYIDDEQMLSPRTISRLKGGVTFSDLVEFEKCYDELNWTFSNVYTMSLGLQNLSTIIYGNGNLQDIVNQIATMFDHPVNIVDSSFSVLTSSTNYEFYNDDLKRDNTSGHVPPEILKQVDLASQRRGKGIHETIVLDNPKWGFKNYLTPIVNNDFVIGYFSIYMLPEENMTPVQHSFLGLTAAQIGTFMQKKDFYLSSRSNYYTALLSSLLTDNTLSASDTERRFSAFGYKLKREKYIVITQIVGELPKRVSLLGLCSILQNVITNSIYTIQNGEIIFLASFDPQSDDLEHIQDVLRDRSDEFSYVKIGFSSPFQKLSEAREHWLEARSAIETGTFFNSKEFFYLYDSYRLMHMVYVLNQSTNINRFLLPQMKQLISYDEKNNTDLLYTLFVYIHFAKNPSKSCEHLHIHRNTLYARVAKIEELTGLNLESMANLSIILVSFAILRMQNICNWDISELI